MTPEERRRNAEAVAGEVRRLLAQKRSTEIDLNATDIEEATDDQRKEAEDPRP